MSPGSSEPRKSSRDAPWRLHLYVLGMTPVALRTLRNLRHLCREHLGDGYEIEVIDLAEEPDRAAREKIFAVPTVIRRAPAPPRKVVGDLSNHARATAALELSGRP